MDGRDISAQLAGDAMSATYTLRADGEYEQFDDLDDAIREGSSLPVRSFEIVDANNQIVWQWSE